MAVSASIPVHTPNPALEAEAVTAHDSTNFTKVARALYIGAGGNATVVLENNDTVLFNGLIAGTILPIRCKRVNATGTTIPAATGNIVALF